VSRCFLSAMAVYHSKLGVGFPAAMGIAPSLHHSIQPLKSTHECTIVERTAYIHDQVRFNVENYERDGSELPEISGLDLKVGGEWAHALYDRAIPNFMNKYLKKWGGKVGTTSIPVGEGENGGLNFHLIAPNGELYDAFRTREQAEDALKSVAQPGSATRWHIQDNSPDDEAVHSIDITPAMRKSLMKEGQPISRNVIPPAFDWAKTAREALAGEREAA